MATVVATKKDRMIRVKGRMEIETPAGLVSLDCLFLSPATPFLPSHFNVIVLKKDIYDAEVRTCV